jgi:hypothetical protein
MNTLNSNFTNQCALGIEVLCITAAEIGENTGLYLLGFNHIGVPVAYTMGYLLATFTTFVSD